MNDAPEQQQEQSALAYTEADLRAAIYAGVVDSENAVQYDGKLSAFEAVETYEVTSNPAIYDWRELPATEQANFIETVVQPAYARYQRGKQVLSTCKIVTSERSTVLGERHYEQMAAGATIVSPVLRWPSGWVAQSEAECYIALARRKPA